MNTVTFRLCVADITGTQCLMVSATHGEDSGQLVVPWLSAFNKDLTVILHPPAGGVRVSVKTLKKRSEQQERRRIEAIGGRRHTGSGACRGLKSDGSVAYRWRMENKFTSAESYRVTLRDLTKLRSECVNNQTPVFNVEFQDKHTGQVKETWVLLPATAFDKLANMEKNLEASNAK
jgi:aromatic ring-cleaving dioxygenase